MKRIAALLLALVLVLTSAPLSFAAGGSEAAPLSENYVANELLITLKKGAKTAALPLEKAEVLDTDALEENAKIVKGTVAYGTDIEALCDNLEARSDVLSADPNYIQTADSVTLPAEASIEGADYNAFNWYKNALRLAEAWQSADSLGSSDVVVAVIDSGVNAAHRELEDAMWDDGNGHNGYNAVNDNYETGDTNGHGSNVAGIIAMRANDFGYVGIAPEVKIMALKASTGTSLPDSNILECLNFAVEHGADIINMSFGGPNISDTMAKAYQRAAGKTVLIAAAGNDSLDAATSPQYPAALNGVIGVMSYGSYKDKSFTEYSHDNGELSSFSNYDASGQYYQLAAPGVNIAGPSCKNTTGFTFMSGTSQATPIVAGTAALYLSIHATATPYQVRTALVEGSTATVDGYYCDTPVKKLCMSAALCTAPAEDSAVPLSDDALALLNACMETNYNEATLSQLEAVSIVPNDIAAGYINHLEILAELPAVQWLDLSDLGLRNEQLRFLQSASFPRLWHLDVSDNPALSRLPFGSTTAPQLSELLASDCAFTSTEDFTKLPALYTLVLSGNHFPCSSQFELLSAISELVLSDCALQDVTAFEHFPNLTYLNVSDNHITDIAPLSTFRGAYLNISYNPLSLGYRQDYKIKSIESFMKENYYTNASIRFLHDNVNAKDKSYVPAKTLYVPSVTVARSVEHATFSPVVTPENADTGSALLFESNTGTVQLDRLSGTAAWSAAAIEKSLTVPVTVNPVSFPAFETALHVLAPEITEFSYRENNFTLKANLATDYVCIGQTELHDYTTEGSERIFTVPAAIGFDAALTATAFDSLGAGNSKTVSQSSTQNSAKATVFTFTAGEENYFVGETAVLTVKANTFTNKVKLQDCTYGNTLLSDCYTSVENGRVFRFHVPLHTAGTRRFKAYAAADDSFGIGAKVLSFTISDQAIALSLYSENGSTLYLSENHNQMQLKSAVFPTALAAETPLTFTVDDPSVATVDANGLVTAHTYGVTIVTASTANGLSADYPVVVAVASMSEPEVTEDYYTEPNFLEIYTSGASSIVLTNADGSPVNFNYETQAGESNIDGYDTYWIVAIYTTTPEPLALRVYAADMNGITDTTFYHIVTVTPTVAVESFAFSQSAYTFDRNGGPVKIQLNVLPEGANDYFNWSISSNTVATIKGYADYCILTPKNSGTLVLTASVMIGGSESVKKVNVTFTEGKIYTAVLDNTAPALYETVTATVITDKTVKYIELTDVTNSLSSEYSDYPFFEDEEDYRVWTLPFCFKRESTQLRVWGGDNVGNLSNYLILDVTASMPAKSFAANPPYITAKVGEAVNFNLISLPSRANLNYSSYSVEVEDESIASFELGTLYTENEGSTVLRCRYGEENLDVPLLAYLPIESITLPESEITLTEGESTVLTPQTTPESAEPFSFSSSNTAVAQVDEDGAVSAVAAGTAFVQITTRSGVSATVTVKVKTNAQIEYLSFDKALYTAEPGEAIAYSLACNLEDTTNKITYTVSNKNILTVDENGIFTAIKEGTATITATSDNGICTTATVQVTARRFLRLNRQNAETTPGSAVVFYLLTQPENADADGVWLTDNPAIAVISQGGVLYAKSPGKTNVFFISDAGEIVACAVTVNAVAAARLSLAEEDITLGLHENYIIGYTASNAAATETPAFRSDNEAVCVVDDNGIIYAVGSGNAIVTVNLANGKSYPLQVTVTEQRFTLMGTVNTAAVPTVESLNGESATLAAAEDFRFENIKENSYTLTLTAVHHTQLSIEEIPLAGDLDLGNLYLPNGDANADGVIDIADLSLLLHAENLGASATIVGTEKDINDDGTISLSDIAEILLAANYGARDEIRIY